MRELTKQQWRMVAHIFAETADDIHDSGDGDQYIGYSEDEVKAVMETAKSNWLELSNA